MKLSTILKKSVSGPLPCGRGSVTVVEPRVRLAAVLAIAGCLGFAGWVWFDASRVLRQSAAAIASEGEIRFVSEALAGSAPAAFVPISTPQSFTSALVKDGRIYVSGPAGLFVYDGEGRETAAYRVGMELPAAPLGPVASDREVFIGTSGAGLLILDGSRLRQALPEKPACRTITAILPLASGTVLLGTPKCGVLAYDGERMWVHHNALERANVTALAGTEESLWIGTLDRGVLHWSAGQLSEPGGLPDNQVLSLAVNGNTVYAGSPLGVAEFVDGRLSRKLVEGFFAQSLLVRGGTLLIGSLEEGVAEVALESGTRPARIIDFKGRVSDLLEIGGKLAAVSDKGLYSLDAGRTPLIERKGALLADRNISSLAVDATGRLWVGYFDRGLEILEADLSRSRHIEDDNVFCVNRIVHSAEAGAAVATANGLVLFDAAGGIRQVLGREDGLLANHVTDVLLEPGRMIAATPAGLTIIDGGGARSLYAFHGLVNNHVYALGVANGRILAGTLGGLSILEAGVVRASYTTANSGLKHNWISALVRMGDEWLAGTYGAGVMKIDKAGHWEQLSTPFEVNPLAMLATVSRVYVGTLDRGLQVYDLASGRWSTVRRGLPSANVTALAEAGGLIYIGTDNGLVRVDEQEILR